MKQVLLIVTISVTVSLLLLWVLSAIIPKYEPVTNPLEMKPLPDYSLEGVMPEPRYYEWDERFRNWFVLYDQSNAKGPVMKIEKFFVDRNNDGTTDLKIINYYMPDGSYWGYGRKKIIEQKAHQQMEIYVDDDLDQLWDRMLSDKLDSQGNPGMDGVFDKEEKVRYSRSCKRYF